jgi:hypothetical protein
VLTDRNDIAEVVSADGVATLGRVASALLGPDGRSVVRTTDDGVIELLLLDDDMNIADTIDLTDVMGRLGVDPLITFVTERDL